MQCWRLLRVPWTARKSNPKGYQSWMFIGRTDAEAPKLWPPDETDEQAGVAWLSWRVSGRWAGRCRAAQLASIKQMSGQVSRGSPIEPILGYLPYRDKHIYKSKQALYRSVYIAALVIITKNWKQAKCPLISEWINNPWCINIMEHYSTISWNQLWIIQQLW